MQRIELYGEERGSIGFENNTISISPFLVEKILFSPIIVRPGYRGNILSRYLSNF